jgi:predicted ATPase/DNA-binding SARP family transcriptional activator
MLDVKLLGQFDVRRNGASIAIPSRSAQSLLAYLILNAGTAYRREQLAGLIWPHATEENARSYLRHELWRLRKAIEAPARSKRAASFLLVDEITIEFDAHADYSLDTAVLQTAPESSVASNDLITALSAYSGELLPGFYDEWVARERERLQAIFEKKMGRLLEVLSEEQRWREILEWGERWVALGHAPEPAYRALMMAHSALGDRSKVAVVYQRCADSMRDQLGVEPSAQTRALFEQLSNGAAPFRATPPREDIRVPVETGQAAPPGERAVPAAPVAPPRSNVPIPLTTFIGREQEIEEIKQLLSTTRLLTLTGAAGVGKTRLAIKVGSDLHVTSQFQDGVPWAELAALTNPAFLPFAVGKVLDDCDVSGESLNETLVDCVASKQLLLVLDNCEHLVAACAELVENLLSGCPGLKILATSREPLGITGETVQQISPLCLPALQDTPRIQDLEECESVRLFVARARAVKSYFALTVENASAVAQICRRLDGLPLAIELAAARMNVLSAQEIAAHLDAPLNLLTGGSRNALPRHQTLRAAIDWSYNLLTEPEQMLLRRLSVVEGGFTLQMTEAVAGALHPHLLGGVQVLDLLMHLVAKSMVFMDHPNSQGETRYRILETVREFTREKLRETSEADTIFRWWNQSHPTEAHYRRDTVPN